MALAGQFTVESPVHSLPATMQAAVYRGVNDVRLETVPVPDIGAGEMLVRVHSCGVCGTDLKKISTGSHSAPRIFGHETSGIVAALGTGVNKYKIGDRVVEPVNTCMKGIDALRLRRGESVLAIGQGPIGIILSVLAKAAGATVITS